MHLALHARRLCALASPLVAGSEKASLGQVLLAGALIWAAYAAAHVAVAGVVLDEVVIAAQIITGDVSYPAGHPHQMFYTRAFNLPTYLAAAIWTVAPDPWLISAVRNLLHLFCSAFLPFALTVLLTRPWAGHRIEFALLDRRARGLSVVRRIRASACPVRSAGESSPAGPSPRLEHTPTRFTCSTTPGAAGGEGRAQLQGRVPPADWVATPSRPRVHGRDDLPLHRGRSAVLASVREAVSEAEEVFPLHGRSGGWC
jgi:hypothetical protein